MGQRDFQFPDIQDPVQWIGITTNWWRLTHLLSLEAFYRAEREGAIAGLTKAMEILRFGQRVQRAQGGLIQWVMGSSFKRQGLVCIRRLLLRSDVRSQQLVALSRELERYWADREGFVFTVKFEYRFALGQFEKIARKELDLNDLLLIDAESGGGKGDFDLDGTKRRLAEVMRSIIRCATAQPGWGLEVAPEDYAGNGESDEYAKQAAEGWRLGLQEGAMEDTALVATRTLLALRAYKQDTGEMARSLVELVPAYLPEIPIDPFDGRSLRYSPSEGIVYSVGANLHDQGGSDSVNPVSARQDRDEPTFRIGF